MGKIDEFENELKKSVGFNPESQGVLASQVIFQKFLENCSTRIFESLEFAKSAGLPERQVYLLNNWPFDNLSDVKLDLFKVSWKEHRRRTNVYGRKKTGATGQRTKGLSVWLGKPEYSKWVDQLQMDIMKRTLWTCSFTINKFWRKTWGVLI